jgi:hypothetical protein
MDVEVEQHIPGWFAENLFIIQALGAQSPMRIGHLSSFQCGLMTLFRLNDSTVEGVTATLPT